MNYAHSIRELARAAGVSAEAVRKWIRHSAWPFGTLPPEGGWDVERVLAWRAATLSPDPARAPGSRAISAGAAPVSGAPVSDAEFVAQLASNPFARARLTLLVERAARMKFDREALQGIWVRRADVEREVLRHILDLKSALMSLPNAFATLLPSSDPRAVALIVEEHLRHICNEYAAGRNYVPPEYRDRPEPELDRPEPYLHPDPVEETPGED